MRAIQFRLRILRRFCAHEPQALYFSCYLQEMARLQSRHSLR
jgi:hypothetical protein